ncbi:MAG: fused MFS/spermidine synthase [Alcaligenaceae bacterium]
MLLFATTVFLSAFLLFQIQPIIAKMILPWFGGSSSVWSVCMVFFQAELLLGYAYVHWLHEKLSAQRQVLVHLGLIFLSILMLPVAADPSWKGDALANPSWAVFVVLAISVGAPYLMLSTTGPLMQAWYAHAFHTPGAETKPYRLYALSNLASMIALLSYPVVIEPFFAVGVQALGWSAGYLLFALAAIATGVVVYRKKVHATLQTQTTEAPAARPSLRECLLWVGLAASASILLLTMTRQLTNDVAPVPFLWVLPLSIYLFSFILVFDAPRYYVRSAFLVALPLSFIALDFVMQSSFSVPVMISLIALTLFVFCMVCHGELVRRKPPVRHLTLFYLMMSVGGALGGTFVGLIAPMIFNAYFELPIGLFMCAALVAAVLWSTSTSTWRVLLIIALLGYGWRLADISIDYVKGYRVVMRNFYSQLRIEDIAQTKEAPQLGAQRLMLHGGIIHGEQFLDPKLRKTPTAYYCHRSGIGLALDSLSQSTALKIGVVGLGAGTLATYSRAGDEMRIYEINDQVLDLARSEFTYLSDSPAKIVPVLGDGRLMLEREAPQHFDLLAMDAFSGDSIPTHLLTLESMKTYFGHLKPDGILAVHITNHYLNLEPVMAAAAQHFGKVALSFELKPTSKDEYCRQSVWVLLVSPERAANLPEALKIGTTLKPRANFPAWTDSFSNLLGILK